MSLCKRITLLCCLAAIGGAGQIAVAGEPLLYDADYKARFAGFTAEANRRLERLEDGAYRLHQEIAVEVLGATLGEVEETSTFDWQDESIRPRSYRYQQSGVSSREEAIDFDWQQRVALGSDEDDTWNLPLVEGVLDKLNFQLVLRQALRANDADEFDFAMIDGDEIENQRYRVTGSEIIMSGVGRLDTVRVERIRETDNGRQTVFWLAKDWDMLLVRLSQTNRSGAVTELTLDRATINGNPVTSLP